LGPNSFFGNACVSRRQIISSYKKIDKAKVIENYKVGDVIKDAVVKGYSNFGCFFDVNNGELDVLVHLMEISPLLTSKKQPKLL
jgi:small subunit ribosomal protein S1